MPLVVLRLFRQRVFVAGLLVIFALNAATGSFLFVLALYLQFGLRYSPLAAGLMLAPASVGFFSASLSSVRLGRRFGNRAISYAVVLSMITWTALAVIVGVNPETVSSYLFGLIVGLAGFAVGSTTPPLFGVVLADVARDDAGSASGVLVTCQQIGSALGVALIGVIFFGVLAGRSAGVNGALARSLGDQLLPTSLAAEQVTTVVADFQDCANDRARSHDPALLPVSCQRPTLAATDPAVRTIVSAGLQRANARDYAQAYVASVFVSAGFLIVAAYGAFSLPVPRRKARRLRARAAMQA